MTDPTALVWAELHNCCITETEGNLTGQQRQSVSLATHKTSGSPALLKSDQLSIDQD